jgi:hypothetical protein
LPYVPPRLQGVTHRFSPLTTSVRNAKPGVGGAFPPLSLRPTLDCARRAGTGGDAEGRRKLSTGRLCTSQAITGTMWGRDGTREVSPLRPVKSPALPTQVRILSLPQPPWPVTTRPWVALSSRLRGTGFPPLSLHRTPSRHRPVHPPPLGEHILGYFGSRGVIWARLWMVDTLASVHRQRGGASDDDDDAGGFSLPASPKPARGGPSGEGGRLTLEASRVRLWRASPASYSMSGL